MDEPWECVVVGGGAAGLSAALVLGRARRRTLVVDAGAQSNRPAHGIGGLVGHDGRPPDEFYAACRRDILAYPTVRLVEGEVVRGETTDAGAVLDLADGSSVWARRVLLATGMAYRPPDLPGVASRWGRAVFHCPFCHGWEVRDRRLAVLDDGVRGVERAMLLRMWSDDITLLTNGRTPSDTEVDVLGAVGIGVDDRPVAALEGPGDDLSGVVFTHGEPRECDGLLVPVTLHQRSPLAAQLGAVSAAAGPLVVDAVAVDATGRTSTDHVFAAGDVTGQMQSVANAVAGGSRAAAMIVHAIANEPDSGGGGVVHRHEA